MCRLDRTNFTHLNFIYDQLRVDLHFQYVERLRQILIGSKLDGAASKHFNLFWKGLADL